MKVLLIYPNVVESHKDISLGLGIISSLLKEKGHKVDLIDTTFKIHKKKIANKLKNFNPNLVAITVATNDLYNAINICNFIKSRKPIPIVCGGYHATISPEDIISQNCFDIVAIGEAERNFVKLVDSIEKRKINYKLKNFWFKKNEKVIKNKLGNLNENLDSLPFADREIFNYQKYIDSNRGLATFISSKGCPFQCTYCINKLLIKKYKGKDSSSNKFKFDWEDGLADLKNFLFTYQ